VNTEQHEKKKFASKPAQKTAATLPVLVLQTQDIEKFRKLWRDEYGEEIGPERARDEAVACLRLVQLAYRPMQPEDQSMLREKRIALANALEQEIKKDTKKYFDNKLSNL
jgi:hypothetical protein